MHGVRYSRFELRYLQLQRNWYTYGYGSFSPAVKILCYLHTCGQDGASQKYSKLQWEKSKTEDKIKDRTIDPALISLHSMTQKGNLKGCTRPAGRFPYKDVLTGNSRNLDIFENSLGVLFHLPLQLSIWKKIA